MKQSKRYGKKANAALSMWVKLTRAFSVFSKAADSDIGSHGLTQPQFGALECLGHLGPMTIGQLCRKNLVSGGNMTVVVDNLAKLALVERVPSKEDRRAIVVQLTPQGQKIFKDIFPKHAKHIANLASVLSESEQEELGRLLKKLGTSLGVEKGEG